MLTCFTAAFFHTQRFSKWRQLGRIGNKGWPPHLSALWSQNKRTEDPILQLALRLPRMPEADRHQLHNLQHQMHDLVFIQHQVSGAGKPQAWSDAKHLAHAALARASAFITRDGAILGSRGELLRRFGIDVLSVEELLMTLPSDRENGLLGTQYGSDFVCADASAEEIRDYMRGECLSSGCTFHME